MIIVFGSFCIDCVLLLLRLLGEAVVSSMCTTVFELCSLQQLLICAVQSVAADSV